MGIKIKMGQRQRLVPPGEYRAKVLEIKKGTYVGKRESLEFFFEIADGDYAGAVLRGYVNAHYKSFSEHTKIRRWVDLIEKIDSEPGDEVDLDIFFNKALKIQVEIKSSRKTGNQFSNVTEVLGSVCSL